MNGESVLYEKKNKIGYVTLNRPDKLNAMNCQMKKELIDVLVKIRNDQEVRAVILKGAGKAFCSGSDIGEMFSPASVEESLTIGNEIVRTGTTAICNLIEDLDKPVIVAINGYALGGGLELILSCDLRVASENAQFGLPEVNLGGLAAGGGTQRLVRLIGRTKALEMALTGETINAEEALQIGLLNKVVPQEKLMPTVQKFANIIASKPPLAVRITRYSIIKGSEMFLPQALQTDAYLTSLLCLGEDYENRVRKFFEEK